jgi:hypothetical protein
VCGRRGALTGQWRQATEQEVARLSQEAQAAESAERAAAGARQQALALLLPPRARLPASPFRFLVIDDPVQAMDPAKVDGLLSRRKFLDAVQVAYDVFCTIRAWRFPRLRSVNDQMI